MTQEIHQTAVRLPWDSIEGEWIEQATESREVPMPWSYEQHPTLPVGELVFSGCTSADDLEESTTHLIGL